MTNVVKIDTFTYHPQVSNSGSNMLTQNVDLNGKPYAQIWTFKNTKTEQHPWHVKKLSGDYASFWHYSEVDVFIREI